MSNPRQGTKQNKQSQPSRSPATDKENSSLTSKQSADIESSATGLNWKLPLAILAILMGFLLGAVMINISLRTVSAGTNTVKLTASLPSAHDADSRSVGRADAPVQIVIYSDFQCSHCESLHREVEGALIQRYVALGQAQLTMRQFPIFGEDSSRAAAAALAAADQGRFWEYRDALFTAFDLQGKDAYSSAGLHAIAEQVGLDTQKFDATIASGVHQADVASEKATGEALGISAVPTVLINGNRIATGSDMLAACAQAINEVLAK